VASSDMGNPFVCVARDENGESQRNADALYLAATRVSRPHTISGASPTRNLRPCGHFPRQRENGPIGSFPETESLSHQSDL
jgi:hypothetical protein